MACQKYIIAHQNINWLSNIIDRLAHFLDEETPDFIIQTEHGLSQENLEGYSLIGGFSRTAHIKGEVVGYTLGSGKRHKPHHYKRQQQQAKLQNSLFELKQREQLLVLGVYRPPSANLDQYR